MEKLYIIAGQKQAKFFIYDVDQKGLRFIHLLDNPLGDVKRSELIRKEAGTGLRSTSRNSTARYAETKRHDPKEQVQIQFARSISEFMDKLTDRVKFDSITVVAEPHFLGKLRAEFSESLNKVITEWIAKDLQKASTAKLDKLLFNSHAHD